MSRAETFRTLDDLFARGLLPPEAGGLLREVEARYAIGVTRQVADLIEGDVETDPIALQYLPDPRELNVRPAESVDPIGDDAHSPVRGVVHRHADRVLLKVVSVCPVYCRFCFRREKVGPGKELGLSSEELVAALDYIRAHRDITEVILTGGDPFMLSARRAGELTRMLETIDHVSVLRWHTRMPVTDPGRVDDDFVEAIRSRSRAVYVAVHVNHPRELTPDAGAALARMADAGVVLLSQTVLLKGVNDNLATLGSLMRALVARRVRPYYLHQLDAAPGTSHFHVPLEKGRELVQRLRDTLTGLAQPTYVVDIPGGVSKALAAASDIDLAGSGARVRGRDGVWRDLGG